MELNNDRKNNKKVVIGLVEDYHLCDCGGWLEEHNSIIVKCVVCGLKYEYKKTKIEDSPISDSTDWDDAQWMKEGE